jgi:muconolactone delta-isomerase
VPVATADAAQLRSGPADAPGLWQADTDGEPQAFLAALPLSPWLEIETTPLAGHPNDPIALDLAAG